MSFLSDVRYTPTAATLPGSSGGDDPRIPLMNLSVVQARMDFLQKFLSDSVNNNVLLGQPQMEIVSSEIASAIQQVIVNGAALISSNHTLPAFSPVQGNPNPPKLVSPNVEIRVDEALKLEEDEIIELDAVELLAEHVHFCEICGKGFKRDANLRMHMRAHGNQFKSPEALAKPRKSLELVGRRVKFSCPFVGCNRNKQHKKFRPLKSVICVKNHFKRSHCPKMHTCTRCHKKSFSVMTDLKSHLKHCGDTRWRCSCGTNFSRKDKLFGHIALFEGHMPAILTDEIKEAEEKGGDVTETAVADEDEVMNEGDISYETNNEFDNKNQYFEGLSSIDDYYYQDLLNSPVSEYSLEFGVGGYFIF